MFVMAAGEGISALTGYTLTVATADPSKGIEAATIYDYNQATSVSGKATGNMLTDTDTSYGQDVLPTGSTVTAINGQPINATGDTIVNGQYGVLTVHADGSYSYVVNSSFRGPYGSSETFTYTVTSPSGNSAQAQLDISLNITPPEQRI